MDAGGTTVLHFDGDGCMMRCRADAVQFVTVRREVGEKFRYALGRDGVNATVVAHELDGYGKPTVTMVEFFYEGRKECLAAQETKSVPMCAACAAYHKAKAGR